MTVRISGFSSGLDVDSLVKQLMKAQQTKYDNMVKKRTKVEWQQEDYRSMSSKIVDFRNNKLSAYSLSAAINAKTTEVTGDTNALTVNATASNATGSLNVKVSQVASSETKVYTFTDADKTKTLEQLGFKEDPANSSNVSVSINGVSVSVLKTGNLSDLTSAINANSSKTKATAMYSAGDAGKAGVFSITATQTGDASQTLVIDAANPMKGTIDTTNSIIGQNAKITVNGIAYEQGSNKFAVNGFTFTVKAQTAENSSTTLVAKQDTDKIVDTIKSFVNDYNTLIASINSELAEKKYNDYKPLTSAEKEEMSDDEVKLWESKAKSGSLHSDPTLSQFISELRTAATSLIEGVKDPVTGKSISIGITTGSYTEKGKLVLDETKLRSALESNPDDVVNLFTARSSDTSVTSKTSGVFAKMMDSSMDALKALSEKAGTSTTSSDTTGSFLESSLLSEQIRNIKSQETREQDRLSTMEAQYYKMFSAMETAINKYNSQASVFQ